MSSRNTARPAGHAIIIRCREWLAHLPVKAGLRHRFAGSARLGAASGKAVISQLRPPGPSIDSVPSCARSKSLLRARGGFHFTDAPRYGLGHAQRADLAIKTQGHATALRGGDLALLIVQIEAGQTGIGRRLDPAFPGRAGRQCRAATRRHPGHRADPPDRPEHQRHHQPQQRHIAQPERVARRQAQVRLDRPRARRAFCHAFLVRAPQRLGPGVAHAHRLRIRQRRQRVAPAGCRRSAPAPPRAWASETPRKP